MVRKPSSPAVSLLLLLVASLFPAAFVGGPRTSLRSCRSGRHTRATVAAWRSQAAVLDGDAVRVLHPDNQWYEGIVQGVQEDGIYSVKVDMPDSYAEWLDVPADHIEPMVVYKAYSPGQEVLFPLDGIGPQSALIEALQPRGYFVVSYSNSRDGRAETIVHAKDLRIRTSQLRQGQRCQGTIHSVEDSGFLVEIGAEAYGKLSFSEAPEELLEVGQPVEVKVTEVEDKAFKVSLDSQQKSRPDAEVEGRLDGRRAEPTDLTPFQDILPNQWQKGVVAKTVPFGAFVTVTLESGESADGLVHISKLQEGFVDNVDDIVQPGDEVKVRIESVDMDTGKMSLSMREQGGFGGGGGGGPRAPQNFEAQKQQEEVPALQGTVLRSRRLGSVVAVNVDGVREEGIVPGKRLLRGSSVRVKVVSVDEATGELVLAHVDGSGESEGRAPTDRRPIRQKMRLNAFADVPSSKWLDGKVVAVLEYGAMVRVWLDHERFADGLVHKTGFQDGPVENVANHIYVGQAVRVRVKRLDLIKQELEFTMYSFVPTSGSDLLAFAKMPEDRWLKGKVRKLMPFGVFVVVSADGAKAEGMVHIRHAKKGFLPKVEDEFFLGQEVDVRVESVDLSQGKMSLTMIEPE